MSLRKRLDLDDDSMAYDADVSLRVADLIEEDPGAVAALAWNLMKAALFVARERNRIEGIHHPEAGKPDTDDTWEDGIVFYDDELADVSTCTRGCCGPDVRTYEGYAKAPWAEVVAQLRGNRWQQPHEVAAEEKRRIADLEEAQRKEEEDRRKREQADAREQATLKRLLEKHGAPS